jgi:ankyrin repeat protein
LAANGAELDAETKAGYTPLHVACHFGSVSMVRFLLERDVKVDVQVSWSVSVKLMVYPTEICLFIHMVAHLRVRTDRCKISHFLF